MGILCRITTDNASTASVIGVMLITTLLFARSVPVAALAHYLHSGHCPYSFTVSTIAFCACKRSCICRKRLSLLPFIPYCFRAIVKHDGAFLVSLIPVFISSFIPVMMVGILYTSTASVPSMIIRPLLFVVIVLICFFLLPQAITFLQERQQHMLDRGDPYHICNNHAKPAAGTLFA